MQELDLIIVGAGPVGLYAAFYAGMRGLSVAIIESAQVPGGQPQNLYPEKLIYDIAGLPAVTGSRFDKKSFRTTSTNLSSIISWGERSKN